MSPLSRNTWKWYRIIGMQQIRTRKMKLNPVGRHCANDPVNLLPCTPTTRKKKLLQKILTLLQIGLLQVYLSIGAQTAWHSFAFSRCWSCYLRVVYDICIYFCYSFPNIFCSIDINRSSQPLQTTSVWENCSSLLYCKPRLSSSPSPSLVVRHPTQLPVLGKCWIVLSNVSDWFSLDKIQRNGLTWMGSMIRTRPTWWRWLEIYLTSSSFS